MSYLKLINLQKCTLKITHPCHKCHSPHCRGPCLSIRPYLSESDIKLSHPSSTMIIIELYYVKRYLTSFQQQTNIKISLDHVLNWCSEESMPLLNLGISCMPIWCSVILCMLHPVCFCCVLCACPWSHDVLHHSHVMDMQMLPCPNHPSWPY